MCQFMSAIILKNRIYMSKTDSHTDLLKELNIADTTENALRLFVRAELVPPDRDVFSDIDNWKIVVDQDILPDWFDKDYYKPLLIEAAKERASTCIFIDKHGLELKDGTYYLKNCSQVKAYGNSQVKAYGNSQVKAYDNSQVEAYDNSQVNAFRNSQVKAYGNSQVEAYDNSLIILPRDSSCSIENITYNDKSVVLDMRTNLIYSKDNWSMARAANE